LLRRRRRREQRYRAVRGNRMDADVFRAPGTVVSELDDELQERIDEPVAAEAEEEARLTPSEAVGAMRINAPVRSNRKLAKVLDRVNADDQIKAWWHVANVNAVKRL